MKIIILLFTVLVGTDGTGRIVYAISPHRAEVAAPAEVAAGVLVAAGAAPDSASCSAAQVSRLVAVTR